MVRPERRDALFVSADRIAGAVTDLGKVAQVVDMVNRRTPLHGFVAAARSNTWPNIVLEVKTTKTVEVLVRATGPGRGR